MSFDYDAIIVGAGHNGMVAAHYLAAAGLRVGMFEKKPFVGGACVTEELWPGFRFSTCAHLSHALHGKIVRDMGLRERGLRALPREGGIAITTDGKQYWGTVDDSAPNNLTRQLTDEELAACGAYEDFEMTLQRALAQYRLGPPPSLEQFRKDIAGTEAEGILETALSHSLYEIWDALLPTDRLKDRFSGHMSPVGRNPNGLGIGYYSINHPDSDTGEPSVSGYIEGGMGVVSDLMREAVEERAVEIHTEKEVARFLFDGECVVGIELADGEQVRARSTLSNLDPKRTFLKLTPPDQLDASFIKRVQGISTSVSCFKFLAVISEVPQWSAWCGDHEDIARGSASLNGSSVQLRNELFDDVEAGRAPRRPSISFSLPSAVDDSLTQPGYHTASCWVVAAPAQLATGSWDDVRGEMTDRIIDQINFYAPNFRASVQQARLRTPLDMVRENGLTDGAIWHVQHEGEHLFWNRPLPELAHYRAPMNGLYLCGAGQHPGGEVSGLPGHNAAHELLLDLNG